MTPDQLTIVAVALLGGSAVIGGFNYLWARIDRRGSRE